MKLKDNVKTLIPKFKQAKRILKPKKCIKGSLMVIIGILNTRSGIGIGRLTSNFTLGVLTYLFLIVSGMIVIEILRIIENPFPEGPITLKRGKILFGASCAFAIVSAISHVLIFNLSVFIIVLAAFIIFCWVSLGFYASWAKKIGIIRNIIICLSFSMGLFHGAALNIVIIPSYIYFFILTSFFLQFARENAKEIKDIKVDKIEDHDFKPLIFSIGYKKTLNYSLYFQIFAMVFLILPIFTNIMNFTLYFFTMIFGLIVIGFSSFLTFKSKLENRYFKLISLLLKIGIFLALIAFIFASV